ncbi:hypothetical protein [Sphingomonas phyllosphaerae]|uniref:hypothetical protein n=1 Tax=Sphingomonas phyllosphaerae TaxID=257003 RepID=UPI00241382F7|nr:hypothetical protein [Sphingomonas phyllosphaerae]
MTVSPTIYVARPHRFALGDDIDHDQLEEALKREIVNATEVTMFGDFYSVDPLVKLCTGIPKRSRKNCRIRFVMGLDAKTSIPKPWDDMRRVRSRLLAEKFVDLVVAIVDSSPVHFHTKLFRFVHRTHPVWFVGSANPGSSRHELMVRLAGRHDAPSAYIQAVLAKAVDVGGVVVRHKIDTFRDFFCGGSLPPAAAPTTLHL